MLHSYTPEKHRCLPVDLVPELVFVYFVRTITDLELLTGFFGDV